jgi:Urease beta subunit
LSIHSWDSQRKDGRVFLVTVHDPICTEFGNLEAALYGSFLPVPPHNAFPIVDESEYATEKMPGAIIARKERIVLNKGRERIKLRVTNNGDRPVQVSKPNSRSQKCYVFKLGITISCRLVLITTSSRQTHTSLLTAEKLTESALTSQLVLLSDSNPVM